eukprot:166930-Chlamydomonas_euryale.AAC.1
MPGQMTGAWHMQPQQLQQQVGGQIAGARPMEAQQQVGDHSMGAWPMQWPLQVPGQTVDARPMQLPAASSAGGRSGRGRGR